MLPVAVMEADTRRVVEYWAAVAGRLEGRVGVLEELRRALVCLPVDRKESGVRIRGQTAASTSAW